LQILLIFSSTDGYRLQFSIPRAYFVYTVWHRIGQHCSSMYACTYRLFDSKFTHHPHPLGYRCAKFRFFRGLHCWEKSRTELLNHSVMSHHPAYLMPREPKLALRNKRTKKAMPTQVPRTTKQSEV